MQHFQSILIIVGLLAIGVVLIHGYLLTRKENVVTEESPDEIDMLSEKSSLEKDLFFTDELPKNTTMTDDMPSDVHITTDEVDHIDFSQAVDDDEQVDSIPFNDISEESPVFSEELGDLHSRAMNDSLDNEVDPDITPNVEATIKDEPEIDTQPQDHFIFNVVAKEDAVLGGHQLLQFFLTSGFRFGEMAIFHRHENSDGTGPILFSIANMMSPGVFHPEKMKQFKSEGVSFFLTAPNKDIDIKASFELMLCAVEQMAEEFDCIVLNEVREPMTQEQFIEYNERLLHYI